MDNKHTQSRRNILKTGLAAATAATLPLGNADAALPYPEPKKPGELKIVGAMGHDYMLERTMRPILSKIDGARIWWARHYGPITPELLSDTDLLLTFYANDAFEWSPSGVADTNGEQRAHLYNPDNVAAIKDGILNRGMGWMAIHNTPWFCGDELNELLGIDPILHREIQPIIIRNLNQDHPITEGIEPFIIQLDEQFGAYLKDPDDPDFYLLFKSQGVHDKHVTMQGCCAERGKGRVVALMPGHYEWAFYQVQYKEILWRAAHWALNIPMKPYDGSFDGFIW